MQENGRTKIEREREERGLGRDERREQKTKQARIVTNALEVPVVNSPEA
jgi:hypothetical protein